MRLYKVEYDSDCGIDDEGFVEWWDVTDDDQCFRCNSESEANWLVALINREVSND